MMVKNSNKIAEKINAGLMRAGEVASLCLIWLGLQTMVIVAEVVTAKSTD